MKGGYKIINFKNVSLSGTPVTMTDVLVDLLNNYDKVVLLSNVVLSGSAKDDCFSTVLSDGDGGVKLNCYDGYISINSSGAVTYTVASESSIPGLLADVEKLKADNTVNIYTMNSIISLNSTMVNGSVLSGRAVEAFVNDAFGLSTSATIFLSKVSANTIYVLLIPGNNEYICKGKITISGTSASWSERYIFEGTAYTPTP